MDNKNIHVGMGCVSRTNIISVPLTPSVLKDYETQDYSPLLLDITYIYKRYVCYHLFVR